MSKLKAAGLALVAMLALSAMLAATASAKYDSEKEVTALLGTSEGASTFATDFGNLVCQHTELTGLQTGTAVGGGVFTSNHWTLHGTYKECKALGFNATVDTTGCDTTFTPPTKTEFTGPHAVVDLIKSGPAACDINIVAAGGLCSINIPEQTEMGLVDFMNEGAGATRDVTIDKTTTSIDYTGVGGFCSGSGTNGTFKGTATVKGFSGANQVGIWVTNT